ncbi:AAA family ATPase, partial [Muricomes intestini]
MSDYQNAAGRVLLEIQKAIVGKADVAEKIMMAVLAGGHVLVEDIPGTGKTTMALAFSKAMGLKEKRVQFTPDVLPADLTGFTL